MRLTRPHANLRFLPCHSEFPDRSGAPLQCRVKKSIPEEYRKTPQASLFTALCATYFATIMCYPLDTIRRQMQMKNSPFRTITEAVPGTPHPPLCLFTLQRSGFRATSAKCPYTSSPFGTITEAVPGTPPSPYAS